MTTDQHWRARAMCDGLDPDEIERMFFPHHLADAEDAKAICRVCPVAAACLTYALDTNQEFGVWGAMTERERAAALGKAPAKAEPTPSDRCGSYSGVSRHRKNRETLCGPCKEARADYEATQRHRKNRNRKGAAA